MKTIKLLKRTVSVDCKKLSIGLCEVLSSDENMKACLSIGMLDARIIEPFEKDLALAIKNKFSSVIHMIYEDEIEAFIKDCIHEITVGIYNHADMIV